MSLTPAILRHAIAAFCAMAFSFAVDAAYHTAPTSTDPLGHITANDYDALNRLKTVTEPLLTGQTANGTIQYGYDAQDNLTSVTDPRGLATGYSYSGFNELKRLTSPDTAATDYTYDAAGNVKTMADARGQNASYSYDALNRLKSLAYSDETLAFTYGDESGAAATSTNSKGRLATLSDGSGNTAYAYDLQGRVTEKRQTVTTGSGSQTGITRYSYNTAGQLATLTTPSAQIIDYGYANNQIVSIKVNGQNVLTGATYFPFGDAKGWNWGNGQSYQRSYDSDGRIQSVTLGNQTRSYGFDDASRLTGLTDKQGSTTTASVIVGYDNLDRLTSATKTATAGTPYNQSFGYDLIGNRTSQTIDAIASTLTYSTTSNRLSGSTGGQSITYGYDNAGNITSDGSYTYGYSGRNRLTQVKLGAAIVMSYGHNGFGERVIKTASGTATVFSFDEDGHLIGEYDQSGNLIQETVWLDDTPVATLMPTTPGQPIGAGNPLKVYYVWADHLDTPRAVTTSDAANLAVWSWDSDPFGTTSATGSITYNLRFPGQYFDQETGTHYNYFRDYNSATGRYQQSDPIGLLAGVQTYSYVGANPLSYNDIAGLARKGGIQAVVIGENMKKRVIPTAKECGARTYRPRPLVDEARSKKNQKRWINDIMNKGLQILDAGLDPGRSEADRSPYYKIEKDEIAKRKYPIKKVKCPCDK